MEINPPFDIPDRLHRNGRLADQVFLSEEKIYRRFPVKKNETDSYIITNPETGEKTVSSSIFRTDQMSCNREKYSESPNDVLYDIINGKHCFACGIVELVVATIDSINLKHPCEDKKYNLKTSHSPEDLMYPHIEVLTYENSIPVRDIKPNSVKSKIKELYSKSCQITKDPD